MQTHTTTAGKSNTMDGVSFAVGAATKQLRGKTLKDLIYRGTTDDGKELLDGDLRGQAPIFRFLT